MRYQKFEQKVAAPEEPVAAVWPSFQEVLLARQPVDPAGRPAEVADPVPATAAPDVPATVGVLVMGSYMALLAVFFTFFAGSPLALFAITVCAVFVAVFFAVPRIFLAVEADPARRPSLSHFWHNGLQTLTGRTGGKDALIQMLIVPVLLTFGLLTIGIIGRIFIG